jgi:hypothetical protein
LDAGGVATYINGVAVAEAYQEYEDADRVYPVQLRYLRGTGTAYAVAPGATRVITIDYSSVLRFAVPGAIEVEVTNDFSVSIYEDWAAGWFELRLTSTQAYDTVDCEYSWLRWGIVMP